MFSAWGDTGIDVVDVAVRIEARNVVAMVMNVGGQGSSGIGQTSKPPLGRSGMVWRAFWLIITSGWSIGDQLHYIHSTLPTPMRVFEGVAQMVSP